MVRRRKSSGQKQRQDRKKQVSFLGNIFSDFVFISKLRSASGFSSKQSELTFFIYFKYSPVRVLAESITLTRQAAMAEKSALNVGTRESELARVQTDHIIAHLQKKHPNLEFSVVGISTKGDKILDKPLPKVGDKGLFTKELEVALADGRVDLVVHSAKDLPSTMPAGMVVGCIFKREDRRDALVMSKQNSGKSSLEDLPPGSVVGTSSLRRIAQLSKAYPHVKCEDVRGNLNTRLRKLDDDDGKYDALVLAAAGLDRLGWSERITARFEPAKAMRYAAGQGALAVEVRESDEKVLGVVETLTHPETLLECIAERSFLQALGGGCSVPIGVNCSLESEDCIRGEIHFTGAVYSLDGKHVIETTDTGVLCSDGSEEHPHVITGVHIPEKWRASASAAARLGCGVAESLILKGAQHILLEARVAIGASS